VTMDERRMMQLSLSVRFETPVNIGGYGAPTFVDRPFRRDGDGWPFIPASSLKGRLRHECERLARGLGYEVCGGPAPAQMHRGTECAICAIFGSPWVPGRIYPADLTLQAPAELKRARERQENAPLAQIRYNVSLSRRRRVAEEARLFTTEVLLPGVPLSFGGTWEAELTLKELALVEAGLGAITALGCGKTGGLGWCHITVQSGVWENGEIRPVADAERAEGRAAW
jgi:CRISPR/Cas system CSM-associated protein Csm3 (group 7 of RAMP superfamily)